MKSDVYYLVTGDMAKANRDEVYQILIQTHDDDKVGRYNHTNQAHIEFLKYRQLYLDGNKKCFGTCYYPHWIRQKHLGNVRDKYPDFDPAKMIDMLHSKDEETSYLASAILYNIAKVFLNEYQYQDSVRPESS